jgi:hypothetical protein
MGILIDIVVGLSILSVVASLFLGLVAMARGGEFAQANSNKFMRWRIISQIVAVISITIGFIYWNSHR